MKKKLETFTVASDDGKLTVELAIDHALARLCITPKAFVNPLWNEAGTSIREDRERFGPSPAFQFQFLHGGNADKWAELGRLITKAAEFGQKRIAEEKK